MRPTGRGSACSCLGCLSGASAWRGEFAPFSFSARRKWNRMKKENEPSSKKEKGRNNALAAQIGQYLVCAELGKRKLIATPFAGNVPAFDILAADEHCRTVPIQVKASRAISWPADARKWMSIFFDKKTNKQKFLGRIKINNPDLIYVCVAIHTPDDEDGKDRFFILTKLQLQDVCVKGYSAWMDGIGWKRPHNPESYDCRFWIRDLEEQYENKWDVISDRLATFNSGQSLESSEK
jgi:hypothetical protein